MPIFFVFYDIFVEPSLAVFSSLALAHYSFRRILMRPGLVITPIVALFLLIVFSLVPL
uniref:Uncharacterized protein n=1 Tax=Arundo donax TaxID=35708 RepID=A0A0A9HQP4_ARUDO